MSEQHHFISPSSMSAMQAFARRIDVSTPHLHVLAVFESPHPSLLVRDTLHGIVVAFSSEADYLTYRRTVRQEGGRHV